MAPSSFWANRQDETLVRARNNAALFSKLKASARTVVLTPAFSKPARKTLVSYCAFRLFQRVFRFCPKDNLRKLINSVSGTSRLSSLGAIWSRTTVESTFGGGEKASGRRVNNSSTRAYNWAVAESRP